LIYYGNAYFDLRFSGMAAGRQARWNSSWSTPSGKSSSCYGFMPLETRAIEPLDKLLMKGETDKEIYLLRRLQAERR
jgi:hypothetical protein